MINKEELFYARDLAKLYNISKQTLIFYDRKNLFKPAYVDTNGYRMYSLKQFFILGIILDLKKMGFQLHDISSFLENRSSSNMLYLLNKQLLKLTKQIELTKKLCSTIKLKIDTIHEYKECKLNEVTLSYLPEEYFLVSKGISLLLPLKQRFVSAVNLLRSAVDADGLKEYNVGGFIFNEELSSFSLKEYKVFCETKREKCNFVKSYGLYVQIYVNTNFDNAINAAKPQLIKFCKDLNVKLGNTIYVKTLKDYWAADSHDGFISKIEIPIVLKE